jgi:Carboxypeptidase regulatory-like domain/Lecithin:cholesterol acyltransferase
MKLIMVFLNLILVVLLTSCFDNPPKITTVTTKLITTPDSSVTGVTVISTQTNVAVAGNIVLKAVITGTGAFSDEVTWSVVSGSASIAAEFTDPKAPKTRYASVKIVQATAGTVEVQAKSKQDSTKVATATFQVVTPTLTGVNTIGAAGGEAIVKNADATFAVGVKVDAGFLKTDVPVSVSAFDSDAGTPPSGYARVGQQTVIQFPTSSLYSSDAVLSVGISVAKEKQGRTFAEVRIQSSDSVNNENVLWIPYSISEQIVSMKAKTIKDTITDINPSLTIKMRIQVISQLEKAISTSGIKTQNYFNPDRPSVETGTFLIPETITHESISQACPESIFSLEENHGSLIPIETYPSSINKTKIPLILVHGWQGLTGTADMLSRIKISPGLCYWKDFIETFMHSEDLKSKYDLFSFAYDSYNHVNENANLFKEAMLHISQKWTQPPVILAHSMGGIVSTLALENAESWKKVSKVFTLGTPFYGTKMILCTELSSDLGRCEKATVHPAIARNLTLGAGIIVAGAAVTCVIPVLCPASIVVGASIGELAFVAITDLNAILKYDGTKDLTWAGAKEKISFVPYVSSISWKGVEFDYPRNEPNPIFQNYDDAGMRQKLVSFWGEDFTQSGLIHDEMDFLNNNMRYEFGFESDGIVPTISACLTINTPYCDQSSTYASKIVQVKLNHKQLPSLLLPCSVSSPPDSKLCKELLAIEKIPVPTGTVHGQVLDALSKTAVSGVTVNFFKDGNISQTITTGADGTFTGTPEVGTNYSVSFTKTGYLSATYNNVAVVQNQTTELQAVLYIDSSKAGPGTVTGTITNAFNGTGVGGAALEFRSGWNTSTGAVVSTATADTAGAYQLSLDAGYYTATVTKEGFLPASFNAVSVGGTTTNQGVSLTPKLSNDQLRVVLNWGEYPHDLDLHATGPDGLGGRFHVYFGSPYFVSGDSTVALDTDDIYSFGPETITITKAIPGVYQFAVHNYSRRGASAQNPDISLATSGARVRVFQGNALVSEFNVPTGKDGTLWTVFRLENGVVTPVSTLEYQQSAFGIQSVNRSFGFNPALLPLKR